MKAFFEQNTFVHSWSRRATEKMRKHYPELVETLNEAAWTVPEISYWSFSFYEIIIPFLQARCYAINVPIPLKLDFSWSLIDGVASIGIGLTQIFDTETHRPWIQRIKGMINVTNGLQLILICALMSPAAPMAFIVAALVDFILSLETLLHAYRCRYFFDYWLKDRVTELKKRESELFTINKEIAPILDLLQKYPDQDSLLHQDLVWLIAQKQLRFEKKASQIKQISEQIIVRLTTHQDYILSFQSSLGEHDFVLSTLKAPHLNTLFTTNKAALANARQEEEKMIQHLFDEYIYAAAESFIFALVTTGWILLCLSSSPQLPAVILIIITASFYLLKNAVQLYRAIRTQKIEKSDQIPYAENKHALDIKNTGALTNDDVKTEAPAYNF